MSGIHQTLTQLDTRIDDEPNSFRKIYRYCVDKIKAYMSIILVEIRTRTGSIENSAGYVFVQLFSRVIITYATILSFIFKIYLPLLFVFDIILGSNFMRIYNCQRSLSKLFALLKPMVLKLPLTIALAVLGIPAESVDTYSAIDINGVDAYQHLFAFMGMMLLLIAFSGFMGHQQLDALRNNTLTKTSSGLSDLYFPLKCSISTSIILRCIAYNYFNYLILLALMFLLTIFSFIFINGSIVSVLFLLLPKLFLVFLLFIFYVYSDIRFGLRLCLESVSFQLRGDGTYRPDAFVVFSTIVQMMNTALSSLRFFGIGRNEIVDLSKTLNQIVTHKKHELDGQFLMESLDEVIRHTMKIPNIGAISNLAVGITAEIARLYPDRLGVSDNVDLSTNTPYSNRLRYIANRVQMLGDYLKANQINVTRESIVMSIFGQWSVYNKQDNIISLLSDMAIIKWHRHEMGNNFANTLIRSEDNTYFATLKNVLYYPVNQFDRLAADEKINIKLRNPYVLIANSTRCWHEMMCVGIIGYYITQFTVNMPVSLASDLFGNASRYVKNLDWSGIIPANNFIVLIISAFFSPLEIAVHFQVATIAIVIFANTFFAIFMGAVLLLGMILVTMPYEVAVNYYRNRTVKKFWTTGLSA